jgi:hypothetical protein
MVEQIFEKKIARATMTITPATLEGILGSILLASFFSFLERLMLFIEDQREMGKTT